MSDDDEKMAFSQHAPAIRVQCEHQDFEDWAPMSINWRGWEFSISPNIEAVK